MAEYPGPQLRQALAVAGVSVGCILDGIVIVYYSPAIPSLLAKDSSIQIDHHHASWIGESTVPSCYITRIVGHNLHINLV